MPHSDNWKQFKGTSPFIYLTSKSAVQRPVEPGAGLDFASFFAAGKF
jgi:hypothetical protein